MQSKQIELFDGTIFHVDKAFKKGEKRKAQRALKKEGGKRAKVEEDKTKPLEKIKALEKKLKARNAEIKKLKSVEEETGDDTDGEGPSEKKSINRVVRTVDDDGRVRLFTGKREQSINAGTAAIKARAATVQTEVCSEHEEDDDWCYEEDEE